MREVTAGAFRPAAALSLARLRAAAPHLALLVPALAVLLPFYLACALLLRYSFNGWDATRTMFPALTLHNYRTIVEDPFYLKVLGNTLRLGGIVTGIALLLAYPLAYVLATAKRKKALVLLIIVPLWMDVLIRSYAWIVLLNSRGLVNTMLLQAHLVDRPVRFLATPTAVVLELLHEVLPFMIVMLASILQRLDVTLLDAAMNLGANPLRAFWRVTLPLSLPGVLASTMLTFSLAISAFAGPLILGGGRFPVMSLVVNEQMTFGMNWPLGSAEAVTLMTLVLILLYLYSLILRRLTAGQREAVRST